MGITLNQALLGVGEDRSPLSDEANYSHKPRMSEFPCPLVPGAELAVCRRNPISSARPVAVAPGHFFPPREKEHLLVAVQEISICTLEAAACPWKGLYQAVLPGTAGEGLFIDGSIFTFSCPYVFLPACLCYSRIASAERNLPLQTPWPTGKSWEGKLRQQLADGVMLQVNALIFYALIVGLAR